MQRSIVILIAVVTLLVGAGVLLVIEGPNPTSASATPSPASGVEPAIGGGSTSGAGSGSAASAPAAIKVRPPSVRLSRVPGSYDEPTYVTAAPGDTSRLFIVEKTGAIRDPQGRSRPSAAVPRHLRSGLARR